MPSRRLTAAVAATAADRHYLNVSDWMGGGKDPFGREGGSPRQFLPYYLNGMPLPPSLMTSLPHDLPPSLMPSLPHDLPHDLPPSLITS